MTTPDTTLLDRARALAAQFRSHPASRSIDDIEAAGEMLHELAAEVERLRAALDSNSPAAPAQQAEPVVPSAIIQLVSAYGDARADEVLAGDALGNVIKALRSWGAALFAPAHHPAQGVALTDEHQAFMAFARLQQFDLARRSSPGSVCYDSYPTQIAWRTWQARAALAQAPADIHCKFDPSKQKQPLTVDAARDLIDAAGLDWHNGWTVGEEDAVNRYLSLVRAVEHANGITPAPKDQP